jgi:hypothetical protein
MADPDRTYLLSNDLLADVAEVYRMALEDHEAPVLAVAEVFGWPASLAASRVRSARRHGLLPWSTSGVPAA